MALSFQCEYFISGNHDKELVRVTGRFLNDLVVRIWERHGALECSSGCKAGLKRKERESALSTF